MLTSHTVCTHSYSPASFFLCFCTAIDTCALLAKHLMVCLACSVCAACSGSHDPEGSVYVKALLKQPKRARRTGLVIWTVRQMWVWEAFCTFTAVPHRPLDRLQKEHAWLLCLSVCLSLSVLCHLISALKSSEGAHPYETCDLHTSRACYVSGSSTFPASAQTMWPVVGLSVKSDLHLWDAIMV